MGARNDEAGGHDDLGGQDRVRLLQHHRDLEAAGGVGLRRPDLLAAGGDQDGAARDALARGAVPVIAEGPFDAIAITIADPAQHAGLAPCGTALTGLAGTPDSIARISNVHQAKTFSASVSPANMAQATPNERSRLIKLAHTAMKRPTAAAISHRYTSSIP